MNRPDDALDPIVERAGDRETWIGVKQGDQEDREFDAAELQRLRAVVAAVEALTESWDETPDHGIYADLMMRAVVSNLRVALAVEVAA